MASKIADAVIEGRQAITKETDVAMETVKMAGGTAPTVETGDAAADVEDIEDPADEEIV
jgi:hypothetical protein